jgi:aminoglycoside 6'-N-acetyltransferase
MADYRFRPINRADKQMFLDWLAQPHIAGWWQDGAVEWALLEAGWDLEDLNMCIVETTGRPFAFVQDYDARHWPMPQYDDLPERARALDTFLGDPAFLGRGHGSGFLRARATHLRGSYPVVAVDPDPANRPAIAAYRRAGFARHRVTPCEDGDPVQVMLYH